MSPDNPTNPKSRKPKRLRGAGSKCIWPRGIEERYGIRAVTRWRWERLGKLPPRDFFVNGEAVGWKPETLDAADRGETKAA